MKITAKQAAEKMGMESNEARGFLGFLADAKIATKLEETAPAAGGKGRGANIYEFDETTLIAQLTAKAKTLLP